MMATPDRRELTVVFTGGAVGALCRGLLEEAYPAAASSWPWVTLAVNLGGAFLLGYFATHLQERLPLSSYQRPLLGTGLRGGLTTFSTMQVELLRMIDTRHFGLAVGYASASVVDSAIASRTGRAFPYGTLVVNAQLDLFGRRAIATSILLRGVEGFGLNHHLRTDRLLTLSEDLPVVLVAVDTRPRIEALLDNLRVIERRGLMTLERARLLRGGIGPLRLPDELHEAVKLTVYVGRDKLTAEHGVVTSGLVPALASSSWPISTR
jgi:fluoride exporter